ncbi:hypothetical protein [Sphingomonas hankookensis]
MTLTIESLARTPARAAALPGTTASTATPVAKPNALRAVACSSTAY